MAKHMPKGSGGVVGVVVRRAGGAAEPTRVMVVRREMASREMWRMIP